MNFKKVQKFAATAIASVSLVATAQAAQAWETFQVNGGYALNTNNSFRLIDGNPRMSLYQHNINDPDQQFDRLPGKSGTLLRHRSTGKCLNAYLPAQNKEINVWSCNAGDPDQNWNLQSVGNGELLISRTGTNFCIDSPTRSNNGRIHLITCNPNNANQRWKSSASSVSGNIDLPFGRGQTWYVCQGYQNSTISHNVNTGSTYGLDLTFSNRDFGTNGCYASDSNVNKSANKQVLSPASGTVYHVAGTSDLVCLSIDQNRSLLIGHINRSVANGQRVSAGQVLGTTLSYTLASNKYAHIHLEGRRSSKCAVGTSVPLTAPNGLQLMGVGDLPDLPGSSDHFKRGLTRP
ncbi:ricin-type beta-trefoil lectin domain protein [Microcoleus sp. BROC3]|uniref:ricin-type beta-trefoil lectin domain protein n=1 Tax=Microcoleus sp. BROC3 TaxID=3055323 RepID=UPI002FCFF4B3